VSGAEFQNAVFINCPFDPDFRPTFDAIVFATTCCGFVPRCASESGTVAEPRMDRILRGIFGSKYSIHDLSRCRGEGSEQLARFNMPLELGMAMARRAMTRGDRKHDWLTLVPEGHQYQRFVSDLAGFDPARYDGTPSSVVPQVVSWLALRPEVENTLLPDQVLELLPAFDRRTHELRRRWHGEPPWPKLVQIAVDLAQSHL
jgi:hypothetical protein